LLNITAKVQGREMRGQKDVLRRIVGKEELHYLVLAQEKVLILAFLHGNRRKSDYMM